MYGLAGYQRCSARALVNAYPLSYWLRLAPVPNGPKAAIQGLLAKVGADRLKLHINVGNTIAWGFNGPAESP